MLENNLHHLAQMAIARLQGNSHTLGSKLDSPEFNTYNCTGVELEHFTWDGYGDPNYELDYDNLEIELEGFQGVDNEAYLVTDEQMHDEVLRLVGDVQTELQQPTPEKIQDAVAAALKGMITIQVVDNDQLIAVEAGTIAAMVNIELIHLDKQVTFEMPEPEPQQPGERIEIMNTDDTDDDTVLAIPHDAEV